MPPRRAWRCTLVLVANVIALQSCSEPQAPSPPHSLDDAAAASQRASEAMKGTSSVGAGDPSAAAASEKDVPGKPSANQ